LAEISAIETAKTPRSCMSCLRNKLEVFLSAFFFLFFFRFFRCVKPYKLSSVKFLTQSAFILFVDIMHCFELKTANADYYVGEDPSYGDNCGQVSPPESGIGAHIARSWETTIRQALMPVTVSTSMYIWFAIATSCVT